jgi:hypothetical protein
MGSKKWRSDCVVTACEPGKRFAFDVKAGPFKVAGWAYQFAPTDSGCLVTELWEDHRGAVLTWISPAITGTKDRAKRNQETMTVTLQRLAEPGPIFELIADPAQQPRWDGNDNLAWASAGQRVRRTGEMFTMTLTGGAISENHVTEFEEGRRIAWMPAEPGQQRPGHVWRWDLSARRCRYRRRSTRGPV